MKKQIETSITTSKRESIRRVNGHSITIVHNDANGMFTKVPDNARGVFLHFFCSFYIFYFWVYSVAIACVVYNFIQKYIGGIEFE
jgi:hypothetical protein